MSEIRDDVREEALVERRLRARAKASLIASQVNPTDDAIRVEMLRLQAEDSKPPVSRSQVRDLRYHI